MELENEESEYNAYAYQRREGWSVGGIDLYKRFYRKDLNTLVGETDAIALGLDIGQIRALVLLHELAHVTGRYIHKTSFADETVSGATQNKRIFDACFIAQAGAGAKARTK